MIQIADKIYWTGVVDWDMRSFHSYSTPQGSTYNSYLIIDDKPTLIDTVKLAGFSQMIDRIREVIKPEKIRYIISNHTEMDHSGSIAELLKICPQAEVVCSPKGAQGLKRHFNADWKFKVVQNKERLSLGQRELEFVLMPMVHWPDSMAVYSPADSILFPNDAFGQHHASAERYADEVGPDIVYYEAAKYYANIVLPYSEQVLHVLQSLAGYKIEKICPSHGLIWRRPQDVQGIVSLYKKWASHQADEKAVIIYDTMWHSTEKIAYKLYGLLDRLGVRVKLVNLQASHMADAVTDVMLSKLVMLGSPILNNRIFPGVGGFLTYLKGLKPKKRLGFTFGSYGWSPAGFKELEDSLKEAGLELICPGRYFQYVPSDEEFESLIDVANTAKRALTA